MRAILLFESLANILIAIRPFFDFWIRLYIYFKKQTRFQFFFYIFTLSPTQRMLAISLQIQETSTGSKTTNYQENSRSSYQALPLKKAHGCLYKRSNIASVLWKRKRMSILRFPTLGEEKSETCNYMPEPLSKLFY